MKIVEKNEMGYMALVYGRGWDALIDETCDDGNDAYNKIDLEFGSDEDWEKAAVSETYWGGKVELDGRMFWIASEYECSMEKGVCFLVEE